MQIPMVETNACDNYFNCVTHKFCAVNSAFTPNPRELMHDGCPAVLRPARSLFPLAILLLGLLTMTATSRAATAPLRLEMVTNTPCLVAGPIPEAGALFVYAAADLADLLVTPTILFQTNTPLAGEVRLPVPLTGTFSTQGFFRIGFWKGRAPALADIPAGTFLMGSPQSEAEQAAWEGPQTTITITYPFKMGKCEVTQAEYQAIMTNNPSYFSGVSNRPVEQVSWTNAMDYCARLTQSQRSSGCIPQGWTYRLPSEAEWEYACRAGTTTAFAYGPDLRSGMANFNGRQEYDAILGTIYNPDAVSIDKSTAVASYQPNAWGLFDMHGNLWEWCLDRWQYSLPGGTVTDPQGPTSGTDRVVRGGCWYNDARLCRSAFRISGQPGYRGNEIGFRIVLAPPGH